MRYMTLILATLFCLGLAGCGEKLKLGETCKRHSQCASLVCSSEKKCVTKAADRATRKAASAKHKASRLKKAQK